jgi:predicted flap endonuclease-1-like 5' DNA nuclease
VRTSLRRARRLGAFLVVVLAAGWVFLRRRPAVQWIEPSPSVDPGAPEELPADVLATDAGLTELPSAELPSAELPPAEPDLGKPAVAVADPVAAGAVAEVVAAEPVEAVVAEEPGAVDEPTETELVAPALGIDEPTMTIAREAIASEDEETGTRIPMPTFSEAPTMEIPAVTDDLRAVRGIGPSMERLLHGLGIISFRQLAMLDGVELERVRAELSDFRTRIEREDWVGQARDLHKEKYGRDPS